MTRALDLGYEPDDLARHPAYDDPDDYRQPFARDYDRLVHTTAFRKLQGKTQVVAPGEAEFLRTRLTHTIEVAQLARRLAERLGAHPDCCEAAAILHDFGHPPFGHIGEEALSEAVDETARAWGLEPDHVGGYEGNAQNFRLVTRVLSGSGAFPGINLTRGTLDASIKYPWYRDEFERAKWCFYPTEAAEADRVRSPVPPERRYAKSFEAQVMDWADDVAYAVHDIEDWYVAGLVPLEMLTQSAVARERFAEQLTQRLARRGKLADGKPDEAASPSAPVEEGAGEDPEGRPTADELDRTVHGLFGEGGGPFAAFATLAGEFDGSAAGQHALRVMRKRLFELFTRGVAPADPTAPPRRHRNDLQIPRELRLRNDVLREMTWIYVIDHPRTATYQRGQRRIVAELFRIYAEAACGPRRELGMFPRDLQRSVREALDRGDTQGDVEVLRTIADHVGAMTDAQAARLHRRLTGQVDAAFFDFE
ncbi:dNTP triphosphohydrolase [Egibacter rhizosphaerae]|uniref:DNTP triphosphohydrolase n=1 Tax=Egibacter rhizosphaerae TaxID=1670831 RepID=A0A411YI23_9ACTN|nr:dNTP triphosphohydrolase [Egibacter rhizosphaerae]QBI20924.1 dNTP triphosphohydrolase [Egibacter rhizosphaerae]